jgi:tetratricopeptide (TPR) repeat protein
MFSKLSYRTKIIIFIVAAVAGIILIISTAVKNKEDIKNFKFGLNNQTLAVDSKKLAEEEQKKKEEEAKKQEDEAKKAEHQKKIEAKYQEGYEAFFSKKYRDAINAEDEVIKEDDKFYKAYNIKGIAQCYASYANSAGYEEGMKNIDKALELKPDYGYARFNKALALELFGHYNDALVWYDKALEVENYEWSYYGKASIYGKEGDAANSVKNLKLAIDINPSVKEAAKIEQDFDNVRNSKEFQSLIK